MPILCSFFLLFSIFLCSAFAQSNVQITPGTPAAPKMMNYEPVQPIIAPIQPTHQINATYFSINGYPIHPACIEPFHPGVQNDSYIHSINLTLCQKSENDRIVHIRKTSDRSQKLKIYVEYNRDPIKDAGVKEINMGYYGYNYIGRAKNGIYVLLGYNNTGGTSSFDDLLLFTANKTGDNLLLTRVGMINGGDRCNGIASAEIKGNTLMVGRYIHIENANQCHGIHIETIEI